MFTPVGKALDFAGLIEIPSATSESLVAAMAHAPDFVKEAEHTPDAYDHLPDESFGLIITNQRGTKTAEHRLYPLYDAASCWLQMESLRRTHEHLPPEARKVACHHVAAAAERYGLVVPQAIQKWASVDPPPSNRLDGDRLNDPIAQAAAQEKTASEPQPWGLIDDSGQGRWPLHTPALVKKAQDYLATYEDQLDPRERWQLATRTAQRAQELGVTITDKTASYAGVGWDHTRAQRMLKERAGQVKTAEEGQALLNLEQVIGQTDPETFAGLVDQLDRSSGFKGTDPYAASMTLKEATWSPGQPLDQMRARDIAQVIIRNQEKLSGHLGQSVVRQLCDHPHETLEGLDDDQREVLEHAIAGNL